MAGKFKQDRKQIKEVNELRSIVGLKPLEFIKRICLHCEKVFMSEGPHNRKCNSCYDHQDYKKEE